MAKFNDGGKRKGDLERLLETEKMKEGVAGVFLRCSCSKSSILVASLK